MTIARNHLRADDLTLPQIADAVGYGSPFAAAFRRHHGEPPGTWRQRERTAAQTRLLTTTTARKQRHALVQASRSRRLLDSVRPVLCRRSTPLSARRFRR
ncbi:hypothetical protein ABT121_00335 [Streptomyces sp. NPDC001928]|uniref:hypothetical protein n=1 Tax=Streptomyces sp. NPDC001928 TaxID=3154404 RepID=UPI00332D3385